MEIFISSIWAFTFVWIFGGLALFTWLRWRTNIKRAKVLLHKLRAFAVMCLWVCLMLAPFAIPIAVTAITFFFEP